MSVICSDFVDGVWESGISVGSCGRVGGFCFENVFVSSLDWSFGVVFFANDCRWEKRSSGWVER